mmetsp:Transcript_11988/g.26521  ORF Transcript_11988/g.26521 Transcript_11988/m.26521 type:complete len:118 (-) Transcript_11988:67-420(-)
MTRLRLGLELHTTQTPLEWLPLILVLILIAAVISAIVKCCQTYAEEIQACVFCILDCFAAIFRCIMAIYLAIKWCLQRTWYPIKQACCYCCQCCDEFYHPYKKKVPYTHVPHFNYGT